MWNCVCIGQLSDSNKNKEKTGSGDIKPMPNQSIVSQKKEKYASQIGRPFLFSSSNWTEFYINMAKRKEKF